MDSIASQIQQFPVQQKCTLLGIGPMSKNCVDATIELSSEHDIPFFLIASRRQIETEKLGHGYCNNWTTESYSKYVKDKDQTNNIFLARDHGGPWQNNDDIKNQLNLNDAMQSAKKSFEQDIVSDFKFLHIDPSEYISSSPTTDEILKRIFELYEFCNSIALNQNKEINYEISVGKDSDPEHSLDEINYIFTQIIDFCSKNHIKKPLFFAVRIGTEVKEDRNVGTFENILTSDPSSPEWNKISDILKLCKDNDIMMKHHNTDYLSDAALKLHPNLGIHAANVAPEFGIIETKSLINLLNKKQMKTECDEFISIAYDSKKWEKWLVENSSLDNVEKAIISGHYVFSTPRFLELKNKIQKNLDFDLDVYLKNSVKEGIKRYASAFNLI